MDCGCRRLCTHDHNPVNPPQRLRLVTGLLDVFFAMTVHRSPRTQYLPGECGPVCFREIPCNVREVKRRRQ